MIYEDAYERLSRARLFDIDGDVFIRQLDAADALIAFLRKDKGGTAYTVRKFLKKKGEEIVFI